MAADKKLDRVALLVLCAMLAITVLFMNGEKLGLTKVVDEDADQYSASVTFTANDLNGDWDTSSATVVTLSGASAAVSGSGAYFANGDLVISEAGKYVISGTLDDGAIVVDAHRSSKVWILLDGVTLTSSDSPCIWVEQADKVFLTLAEVSENILNGCDDFADEDCDGVLYARDDVTINGSGSLTILNGCDHGIAANDDIVITGGTITVEAARDAVHVNDSFRLCGASVTLTAGDDGVAVTGEEGFFHMASGELTIISDDDAVHTTGDITMEGGTLTIDAGDDGVHSDTAITISGGTILLNSCYEGLEAKIIEMSDGDVTVFPRDDGFNANGGSGSFGPWSSASAGEETYIRISGGAVTIVNETGQDADGLDSNGDICIEGGVIRISLTGGGSNCALDCGSESGGVAEITGGTVIACGGSTMAEGFSSTSTQPSLFYSVGGEAGSALAVRDSSGETILSWDVPCSFTSAVISCPEMTVGETYTVTVGDSSEEVTLTGIASTAGSAGSTAFGGMNWGGNAGQTGIKHGNDGFTRPDDTETTDATTQHTRPDRTDNDGTTERPARPDDAETSETDGDMPAMPDDTDMPALPENGGETAQPVEADASFEHGQDGGHQMTDFDQQQTSENDDDVELSGPKTLSSFGVSTWTLLAASCAALLLGVAAAVVFKDRIK